MPTAADLMTPAPRTCSTFSTVLEAVMIFRDADCGAVPVTEDGEPVGILTDRDVALALIDKGGELIDLPVSDIMTRGVVSIRPDASLEEIESTFAEKAVRRLLVTSGGQLVGIVAWHDVSPYVSPQKLGRVVSDVVEKP
ncbi:MAG TPA: CBS domain-containing protein [Isosphaeraceae bacterium]|jgi:CBS domain-containing protein|nr:CBS domain-containing protein [Isosphaeraceae bacterium]